MDRDSKQLLRKIVIDVAVLLTVGIPILIFYLFGTPYKRGFYCNDESLMHPFKDSTVTNTMLYIIGLCVPITVIILTEICIHCSSRGHVAYTFQGRTLPSWIWNSYKVIGVFGFGAASSQLTTDIAKYTIGRLRPHFMKVCKPSIDCTRPENQHIYWEDFECTSNEGSHKLKEARLSFPSGHSSFSAYTMLFLVCYLQSRMTFKGSKLLKHGLQYLCLMLSWSTAMTRISNYKHHWSDVLCGLLIGCIVAVLTVVFVSDLFPRKRNNLEEEPSSLRRSSSRSNSVKREGQQYSTYESTLDQQNDNHHSIPMHSRTDGTNGSPVSPRALPVSVNQWNRV